MYENVVCIENTQNIIIEKGVKYLDIFCKYAIKCNIF